MTYPLTVRDLMQHLGTLNPDANVHILVDGDLCPIGEVRPLEDGDDTSAVFTLEENA